MGNVTRSPVCGAEMLWDEKTPCFWCNLNSLSRRGSGGAGAQTQGLQMGVGQEGEARASSALFSTLARGPLNLGTLMQR